MTDQPIDLNALESTAKAAREEHPTWSLWVAPKDDCGRPYEEGDTSDDFLFLSDGQVNIASEFTVPVGKFLATWNPTTALSILSRLRAAETEVERAVYALGQAREVNGKLFAKLDLMKAERDEARAVVIKVNNSFGCEAYFTNPHPADQVENLKESAGHAYVRATSAEAQIADLEYRLNSAEFGDRELKAAITAQAETSATLRLALSNLANRGESLVPLTATGAGPRGYNEALQFAINMGRDARAASAAGRPRPNTGEQSQ